MAARTRTTHKYVALDRSRACTKRETETMMPTGGESGTSPPSCLPLLVFQHQGDDDEQHEMLMFSVSQKRLLLHHAADVVGPDLVAGGDHMCWTTPQGWMLQVKPSSASPSSSSAAFLWNPRTGDKITTLPDVVDDDTGILPMECKCLLTHRDATHPGCFVVLFHRTEPTMWYCKVAAADDGDGRRRWRRYTYDVGDYEVPTASPTKDVISSVAAVQGELFFDSSSEDMCAITFPSADSDSDEPEFQYFDVTTVGFPAGMFSGMTWLVESDEQLFLVCVCFVDFDPDNIGAVTVHRMDFSTEAWRRVHDIGDAVFLLEGANMAASCPASPLGLKANQIYFMRNFRADDADLCIFDVETETMEVTRVHQRPDLLLYRQPFWILPPQLID